jgi:hypothetical protein
MRNIFYTLLFAVALAFTASAQNVRVGAFLGYTTAPDHESPNLYQDTNKFFPGVTASAEFGLPKGFGFKVSGDVSKTPQLPALFSTDEGEHKPKAEVRVHPQVVYGVGKVFFAAGVDTFYHFFSDDEADEEYSRSYGFNPTVSVGVKFNSNHEVSATYLFRDKGTDLYGVRANYFYTLPKGFRVGFEANHLTFRERDREGYIDSYYEEDNTFKLSFEIPLTKGNKYAKH